MNNQNLLIYDSEILYNILDELKDSLNFKIKYIKKSQLNDTSFSDLDSYLILTTQKNINIENQLLFSDFPVSFSNLYEKINIEFLKKNFNQQSNIDIGSYKMNVNSRELILNNKNLKLTEKEIEVIVYLSKKNNSISIDELQKKVWGHQSELETHTVETHIHRLRKKIKDKFNDKNLILSTRNGYKIN
mgnify:CR=1 FL=1|tara:strand:+ start:7960 stop:8523 length:564 start_codon:yes stop_codon:yes gene_type:complete